MAKTITIWIPALSKGAPLHPYGMKAYGYPYRTREEAYLHKHWPTQAPFASAHRVTLIDGASDSASAQHAWNACDGDDGELLARFDETFARIFEHLRARRWASAVEEKMRDTRAVIHLCKESA